MTKEKNNEGKITKKDLLDFFLNLNSTVIELKTIISFLQNNFKEFDIRLKDLDNCVEKNENKLTELQNEISDLKAKLNAFIKIFYPLNTATIFLLVINLIIAFLTKILYK